MEESHWKSDSAASASKSLGSLVQINSIAIDISSAMEEIESPAHEHFSIRGFVAEMRKKDWKACSPFASERNDIDLVDNLPPLFVPKFRWWQCSNCIPDIATKRITEEMVVAGRSCDPGTSSCQKCGEKNSLFLHSRENIATFPGNKLGSGDNAGGEDNDPSNSFMTTNVCCMEGRKATSCSKDNTDVRDKEAGNPCADMSETNPFQIRERLNNTADAPVRVSVHPSCIVDEPENASSGSDGTFCALPYRRKPKLRSLADIMVEERNPTSDNPRTKSASSGGMQVTSTETEPALSPQAELDVSADVAKAARSPPRKRKIALEEDRGRSGAIYANTTKRLRGLMPDAEKSSRRVEISESESEGNASMRLDFGLVAKTQRIKPKKHKALDISKKMRQVHTENGTVPMRELPKIHAADLQTHAVCNGTSFGKLGSAPSTVGEMGPYFSSISGQHIDRMSNLSKSKTPEVESDRDRLVPPSQTTLGDCNVKEKVALELSLNSFTDAERDPNNQESFRQHTGIPDLNETFPLKTATTQGKQLPTFSEKRSFPLHTTLFFQDVTASCSKETTRETKEGKRQMGVSGPQNKDKNMELGASDDIPMEIVELLAKNQRERALGSSRRQPLPEGINSSVRGSPPLFMDGRPAMINFPLASRRTGITVGNGNMEFRQDITATFPQLNNCRLDINKPEESQFRLFGSPTPSRQRETRYSASSSVMTGPRPGTGAELLWSPTRENPPFHLSIPQNRSIQTNNISVHSFSDKIHLGKTINHMKSGKGKKAVHDTAVLKEGRKGLSSTSTGPLDPYSNDTIPAMQLLSLMDQRIVSSSSFEVGPKSFLDKPFSPCNHHPRLNGKENQNFLGGSFFSQNSHSKDLSGLCNRDYCSGESSKKASSYLQGQVPPEVGNSKATLAIQPARSDAALGVCTLNRNPADFSIPEARNEFTLSAKDFKFRKRNGSKEKSRSANVEGRKRQRVRKDASMKETSRK
ncbi:hypothetical protein CDL12_04246 [Handroanthus impetiginosus]|uniref:Uncharacterized protein n=1 Tax=Handroanthus impetiginosus TaxID=429701 RepID=A0A2G9HZT9_9LAMI|nr:hypothetical protein CDL12_04246 [Handroanthus impetiginosus]